MQSPRHRNHRSAAHFPADRRQLQPAKLLLSKWTAVRPQAKEKHFLVTKLIEPDIAGAPMVSVEIEAVHSRRARVIAWRELADTTVWLQGWR